MENEMKWVQRSNLTTIKTLQDLKQFENSCIRYFTTSYVLGAPETEQLTERYGYLKKSPKKNNPEQNYYQIILCYPRVLEENHLMMQSELSDGLIASMALYMRHVTSDEMAQLVRGLITGKISFGLHGEIDQLLVNNIYLRSQTEHIT
jgi:hypothetical protein